MKTAAETVATLGSVGRTTPVAPSLRVPVTRRNRDTLRQLRAAEMIAWEAADRLPQPLLTTLPTPKQCCIA